MIILGQTGGGKTFVQNCIASRLQLYNKYKAIYIADVQNECHPNFTKKYKENILIKVIDAQSLQGVYESIRHRVFRYPAFIINQKCKYFGRDKLRLDALLQNQLASA
jgi:hypothetical protein